MTTPKNLPWRATSTAEILAVAGGHVAICGDPDVHGDPQDQANAEFIAHACNNYGRLRQALAAFVEGSKHAHWIGDPKTFEEAKAVLFVSD